MHIIDLTPIEPGVYNEHKADHIVALPDGWAYIPEDFPLPSTFPRLGSVEAEEVTYTGEIEVERDGEVVVERIKYTMMTVTAMTEGTSPDPIPEPDPVPTTEERVTALEEENAMLKAQIAAQSDQMDFYEECIVEMASVVYA